MDCVVAEDELLAVSVADDSVVRWNDGFWDIFSCKTGAGVGKAWIEDKGADFIYKRVRKGAVKDSSTSLTTTVDVGWLRGGVKWLRHDGRKYSDV